MYAVNYLPVQLLVTSNVPLHWAGAPLALCLSQPSIHQQANSALEIFTIIHCLHIILSFNRDLLLL